MSNNYSVPKVSSEATLNDMEGSTSKRRFSLHSIHSHTSSDPLDPDFHLKIPSASHPHYHHDIEKGENGLNTSSPPTRTPSPSQSPDAFCYGNNHIHNRTPNPIRGNAGVLALLSFSVVTFLLGCYNLFLPNTPKNYILPSAILFGGLSQMISGFFCIINGITFSGILFVSYGSFWCGTGLMMIPAVHSALGALTEDEVAVGDGIYHFIWAFYTLFHIGVSFKIKNGTFMSSWNLIFVFFTLLFEGIAAVSGVVILTRISGATAFLAAGGAMYTAYGELMEEQDEHCWMGEYKRHKKA
ncbi:unnamed protein product [Cunninghamella blakesleeana]